MIQAPLPAALAPVLVAKRERLLEILRSYGSCAVALSGGVDSAVVAKAAHVALGEKAIAVTGSSASLASGELESARATAASIGIAHRVVETDEFSQADYVKNAPDRCYYCKTELYGRLERLAPALGVQVLANGANVDDLGDYRPGMAAAAERGVKSPLVEAGLNKSEVRELAAHWGLDVWDKPASPCLSSRIAYGVEAIPARVAAIDRAEMWLRTRGLGELRVRCHAGELARIEVPTSQLVKLCDDALRRELVSAFKEFGFHFITLDLEGFRSGSLNALVTLELPRASHSGATEVGAAAAGRPDSP